VYNKDKVEQVPLISGFSSIPNPSSPQYRFQTSTRPLSRSSLLAVTVRVSPGMTERNWMVKSVICMIRADNCFQPVFADSENGHFHQKLGEEGTDG
jgi:hypothetical protein